MNQLINSLAATMTSREIATLTGSRHTDVVRSIKRLMDGEILTTPLALSDFEHKGNTYSQYHLDKRDSLVVVARLCPEFMAAIVDRWQELEGRQHQLPQTMAEALRLAADQQDKIEEQAAKIALDAPKVAYIEDYMKSDGLRGLQEAAKVLRFKPREFTDQLKADGFLYYLGNHLVPYQTHLDKKLFQLIEGNGSTGHAFSQTKITTTGMAYFAHRYTTELRQ